MAPTTKLIAPGVTPELIEKIAEDGATQATAKPVKLAGSLAPVNAWMPPLAYGASADAKKAKRAADKISKKEASGTGISADYFLQYSGLPFLPADAPQRMALNAKFRLQRRHRVEVCAKTPPTVGTVCVVNDPADEVKSMAVSGDSLFVATETQAEIWSHTAPPHQEGDGPGIEARVYSELFEKTGHAVVPLSSGHGILAGDFAPDSALLLTSGMYGDVSLWSTETGRRLVSYAGHSTGTPVWSVKWSPAATYFLTGAGDATAKLWRTDIPCFLRSLVHESGRHVQSIAWHPNCQVVLTATEEEVCMWDLLVPRQISRFAKVGVSDLSFSPSGILFGASSDSAGLEVWDTAEQKLLFNQDCPAKYMAWSWPMTAGLNDGGLSGGSGFSQLVSVERDGKIRLFDRLNENKPSVCELPVERPIRPYAAQFSWRNFLMVAGVQDDIKIS